MQCQVKFCTYQQREVVSENNFSGKRVSISVLQSSLFMSSSVSVAYINNLESLVCSGFILTVSAKLYAETFRFMQIADSFQSDFGKVLSWSQDQCTAQD